MKSPEYCVGSGMFKFQTTAFYLLSTPRSVSCRVRICRCLDFFQERTSNPCNAFFFYWQYLYGVGAIYRQQGALSFADDPKAGRVPHLSMEAPHVRDSIRSVLENLPHD